MTKLTVAQAAPEDDGTELRRSAAMFAQCLIDEASRRARTPEEKDAIKKAVVEEIRAQFFAKDVTPKEGEQ